jgi:hypothetical protein
MEETSPPSGTTMDCDRGLMSLLASRRDEARQYLAEQQRRLGELEAALAHQIGHLTQQLNQARQAALATETELLESRGELEAATKKLRLDERGLAQLRRESEANAEELAYLRQRLQQKLADLDLDREKLDELRAETKSQRVRIAHQLKAERDENHRQFERQCAELDERRAALAEPEALARQLDEAKKCLAEAAQQLQCSDQPPAVQGGDDLAQALADMTRRYELAMEDLREQKRLLAEKEKESSGSPRRAAPVEPSSGKLDWETQKQRLLATLEADSDEDDDDDRRDERLKMREVIERTDAAIAAKDREIEELRQLLDAQSASIGEVAVGATAFADVLSSDEIVKTERERLQQLQQEWEEKLRQAEIELSVQRARIARERAEIEERQRMLQDHQSDHAPGGADSKPKPQRGRWLARLGLKEDES